MLALPSRRSAQATKSPKATATRTRSPVALPSPSSAPARAPTARRRRSLLLKPSQKPAQSSIVLNLRRSRVARASSSAPRSDSAVISASNLILNRKHTKNVARGPMRNSQIARERPESLKRPNVPTPVNYAALASSGYSPELRMHGLHKVTQDIIEDGQSMFDAARMTTVSPLSTDSNHQLPRSCSIAVPSSTSYSHAPTHMLAVYQSTSEEDVHPDPKSKATPPPPSSSSPLPANNSITVYPVHSQVLAVSCPRLPSLPIAAPMPTNLGASCSRPHAPKELEVPIAAATLPSPETFGMLLHGLYTRSFTNMLNVLLPEPAFARLVYAAHDDPAQEECYDPRALAEAIAATWTSDSILGAFHRVYGVYRNACALGVTDENVWLAIDIAWRAYRDALMLERR